MNLPQTTTYKEKYEHILMCLICRNEFDEFDRHPKFLNCHHTFCKECLRECLKQTTADDIECPSCRKITSVPAAGVTALQTNYYVMYIQGLVNGPESRKGALPPCNRHADETVEYHCRDCDRSICAKCHTGHESPCAGHDTVLVTSVTEEHHRRLQNSFTQAQAFIEKKRIETEAILKSLAEQKDEVLNNIDRTMTQHIHTLQRRATLLKNNAIDLYNEERAYLESDLEDIAVAKACVVSLRDYHEERIGRAFYQEIETGLRDIDDVYDNIKRKVVPAAKHIFFENSHGAASFEKVAKDLGRVRSKCVPTSDPSSPRSHRQSVNIVPESLT